MTIKVILHRILVKRDLPVDTEAVKTKKEMERMGLTVPKSIQDEIDVQVLRENASMDKGVVVDIGETAFLDYKIDSPIKVGDYVCFARFGGKDIEDPETKETFVILQDEDIVAIITQKEPVDGR